MDKQEVIDAIKTEGTAIIRMFGVDVKAIPTEVAVSLVDQLDEAEKPTVSQVALEYYEAYVDRLTGFDEWFGDFFDRSFLEEFPRGEELSEWLYDNDTKTNLERELALATLIVKGSSSVNVEQEKLYTVEIPNPNETDSIVVLRKWEGCVLIDRCVGSYDWRKDSRFHLTESEIRKDFEWAWNDEFAKEVE